METLTGKMVSNSDQRVRDHEFQNKKKAVVLGCTPEGSEQESAMA